MNTDFYFMNNDLYFMNGFFVYGLVLQMTYTTHSTLPQHNKVSLDDLV